MRFLIACAVVIATTVALGGCFGHHQQVVVSEPLKFN
jgi:hypothetical protein